MSWGKDGGADVWEKDDGVQDSDLEMSGKMMC